MNQERTELILGIDDAGRGPLIGPMALAGCIITKKTESELKKLDVKDSKLLTPAKREFLASKIKEKALAYHVVLAHASEIDTSITSGTNLNTLEAQKAAEIINKLTKNTTKKIQVVIDCPSVNRESWKQDVLKNISDKTNLVVQCEHKADQNHVAVSAASVLAKSRREQEIAKLRKKIGKDFGSGYPNDPKTKEFLKKHSKEHKNDGIFRETWQTFKKHHSQKKQKKLLDF